MGLRTHKVQQERFVAHFMKSRVSAEKIEMDREAQRQDDRDVEEGYGICGGILIFVGGLFTVLLFPITTWFAIKIIQEYERAVIFRLGRINGKKAVGPGMFFVIPCTDSFLKVDMRTVSFDIPPQEILTRDSVTIAVDAVVYYRVFNAVDNVQNVDNAGSATRLLAQTTLRNILGTRSLSGILAEREAISGEMLELLDTATDPWGIKVERVEVKDVRLPQQLQRAMAAEAEAARDAKAKIIAAEGEMNASKSLKEAADVISSSSSALQLRYLQTLTQIATEKNSTIIFPIPLEMFKGHGMAQETSPPPTNQPKHVVM